MAKKIRVDIVADADGFNRGIREAEASTEGFGHKLGGLGKAATVASAAVLGGLVVGLKSSVDAAKEAALSQSQMEDALRSAGIAYKDHASAIDGAIQKTSQLAALDDEDLQGAFTKLVRTSGDVNKSLEGMSLAADIARARHIDLEAATKLVEKAMLGNENAFKKVGVEVEKGAGATAAFAAAQEKFAGSAEAYGNTAAGAQERLAVSMENLQEKLGTALLPVLQEFTNLLVKATTFATEHSTAVKIVAAAIAGLAATILTVNVATAAFSAIQGVARAATVAWTAAQWLLNAALTANPVGVIIVAVAALAAGIVLAYQHSETFRTIVTGAFDAVKTAIQTAVGAILLVFDKFLGGLQAIAEGASHIPVVGKKFDGLADAIGRARDRVQELRDQIEGLHDKTVTVTVVQNNFHHRAAGGPVAAGESYIVGEHGPEMFVPDRGGTIVPNSALGGGDSAAGGAVVFNNYAPIWSERELEDLIVRMLAKRSFRGALSIS